MREIKFRALNKNNEFIYGLPYTDGVNETAYFKEYNNRLCWRRESDGASCNQPYKNGTLSQYTGLKDKNGTEIYEGDIVSGKLNKRAEIKWMPEHCAFLGYCIGVRWTIEDIKYYYLECGNGEQFDNIEVIGNIYENPDLLEEA